MDLQKVKAQYQVYLKPLFCSYRFLRVQTYCILSVKVKSTLHGCAGWPELLLSEYALSSLFSFVVT